MFKYIKIFLFIIICGLLFVETSSASDFSCKNVLNKKVLSNKIDELFKRAYKNPKVYQCSYCAGNTFRFYRFLKANLGDLINATDFNIHYVARPEWFKNPGTQDFPFVSQFSRADKLEKEKTWGFHVFLEFDNKIYDLDYQNPGKILSVEEYFRENLILQSYIPSPFPNKKRSTGNKLHVLTVPGQDFFTKDAVLVARADQIYDFYTEFGSQTLLDFLEN